MEKGAAVAPDELSGPLHGQPIDLDSLVAACAAYDRTKREADGLNSYNRSLARFREMIGVRIHDDESLLRIDLSREVQVRVLIDLFLNPWGCRLPKWSSPDRARIVSEICGWWNGVTRDATDELALPDVTERLGDAENDLGDYEDLYEQLARRIAKGTADNARRPAAASKILYVLRPHFFIAWDRAIRRKLKATEGTGKEYVAFLEEAHCRARELVRGCGSEKALMERIGQPDCTVAEALNKYCWSESRPSQR
jgi:hypothetical protein